MDIIREEKIFHDTIHQKDARTSVNLRPTQIEMDALQRTCSSVASSSTTGVASSTGASSAGVSSSGAASYNK